MALRVNHLAFIVPSEDYNLLETPPLLSSIQQPEWLLRNKPTDWVPHDLVVEHVREEIKASAIPRTLDCVASIAIPSKNHNTNVLIASASGPARNYIMLHHLVVNASNSTGVELKQPPPASSPNRLDAPHTVHQLLFNSPSPAAWKHTLPTNELPILAVRGTHALSLFQLVDDYDGTDEGCWTLKPLCRATYKTASVDMAWNPILTQHLVVLHEDGSLSELFVPHHIDESPSSSDIVLVELTPVSHTTSSNTTTTTNTGRKQIVAFSPGHPRRVICSSVTGQALTAIHLDDTTQQQVELYKLPSTKEAFVSITTNTSTSLIAAVTTHRVLLFDAKRPSLPVGEWDYTRLIPGMRPPEHIEFINETSVLAIDGWSNTAIVCEWSVATDPSSLAGGGGLSVGGSHGGNSTQDVGILLSQGVSQRAAALSQQDEDGTATVSIPMKHLMPLNDDEYDAAITALRQQHFIDEEEDVVDFAWKPAFIHTYEAIEPPLLLFSHSLEQQQGDPIGKGMMATYRYLNADDIGAATIAARAMPVDRQQGPRIAGCAIISSLNNNNQWSMSHAVSTHGNNNNMMKMEVESDDDDSQQPSSSALQLVIRLLPQGGLLVSSLYNAADSTDEDEDTNAASMSILLPTNDALLGDNNEKEYLKPAKMSTVDLPYHMALIEQAIHQYQPSNTSGAYDDDQGVGPSAQARMSEVLEQAEMPLTAFELHTLATNTYLLESTTTQQQQQQGGRRRRRSSRQQQQQQQPDSNSEVELIDMDADDLLDMALNNLSRALDEDYASISPDQQQLISTHLLTGKVPALQSHINKSIAASRQVLDRKQATTLLLLRLKQLGLVPLADNAQPSLLLGGDDDGTGISNTTRVSGVAGSDYECPIDLFPSSEAITKLCASSESGQGHRIKVLQELHHPLMSVSTTMERDEPSSLQQHFTRSRGAVQQPEAHNRSLEGSISIKLQSDTPGEGAAGGHLVLVGGAAAATEERRSTRGGNGRQQQVAGMTLGLKSGTTSSKARELLKTLEDAW